MPDMSRYVLVMMAACASGGSEARPPVESPGGGAVVLELFTSQGCSSCPPADRLLGELVQGGQGRELIAVAYHVDYWNDLGWVDPFSTREASERQERYAVRFGRGPYTPQLVINGRAHVVGSQRGAVERAIRDAAAVPGLGATATLDGDTLRVTASPPGGARAALVVWEDGLATDVRAGENRGEQLREERVVRAIAPLDGGAAAVALDPAWRREGLGAAVLARGDDDAIVAAARLRW